MSLTYSKTVPDIVIEYEDGDVFVLKSAIKSLVINEIDFTVKKNDGLYEITVANKHKRYLDSVVRRISTL